MIRKEDLLLKASTTSDEERLTKLLQYHYQEHGVMLYRYRHVADKDSYELTALATNQIWASNPDKFDDRFEFIPSVTSPKDYECVKSYMIYEAKKRYSGFEQKRMISDIENSYRSNRVKLVNTFRRSLRNARREFAVTCFTENKPYDRKNNMWQQYAKGSGICLGYSIKTLVEHAVIFDPVYYVEPEEKSFANMINVFGDYTRAALCFCIKDKYGNDKYDPDHKTVSWEDQKEWRYAIDNEFDSAEKEYKPGLYLKRTIKPDIVYVKNLKPEILAIVRAVAEKNNIPVRSARMPFSKRFESKHCNLNLP